MKNLLVKFLRALLSLLVSDVGQGFESRLRVSMSCVGPDGKEKWRDDSPVRPSSGSNLKRQLATAMLLCSLLAAAVIATRLPELTLLPVVFGRVTTIGLNKLLDATLKTGLSGPTWFAFLMKQVASDGAISTGTAAFTSASGTFSSTDVGRAIIVQGAGASGADLSTTISVVTSATAVTLAANAGTTVSGARYAIEARLADTMASHTSFVESTSYSNATRVAWTPGTIANGSVDNSASVAAFTINATDWIFGAGLVDNSTKGGTTGNLYGAGLNSGGVARQVLNDDILNVTITASVTST